MSGNTCTTTQEPATGSDEARRIIEETSASIEATNELLGKVAEAGLQYEIAVEPMLEIFEDDEDVVPLNLEESKEQWDARVDTLRSLIKKYLYGNHFILEEPDRSITKVLKENVDLHEAEQVPAPGHIDDKTVFTTIIKDRRDAGVSPKRIEIRVSSWDYGFEGKGSGSEIEYPEIQVGYMVGHEFYIIFDTSELIMRSRNGSVQDKSTVWFYDLLVNTLGISDIVEQTKQETRVRRDTYREETGRRNGAFGIEQIVYNTKGYHEEIKKAGYIKSKNKNETIVKKAAQSIGKYLLEVSRKKTDSPKYHEDITRLEIKGICDRLEEYLGIRPSKREVRDALKTLIPKEPSLNKQAKPSPVAEPLEFDVLAKIIKKSNPKKYEEDYISKRKLGKLKFEVTVDSRYERKFNPNSKTYSYNPDDNDISIEDALSQYISPDSPLTEREISEAIDRAIGSDYYSDCKGVISIKQLAKYT